MLWQSQIRCPTCFLHAVCACHCRGFKRVVPGKGEQLTVLAVEVHADCRGSLLPDPNLDAIRCDFLCEALGLL